ncbi:MAG: potassium transporter TrkG [Pirellulaceae bacterium]
MTDAPLIEPTSEPAPRPERWARRIRTAEWSLLIFGLVVLLLGHGVERYESVVAREVDLFITGALALLVTGFAVRFYLNADKREFFRQRWFQILVQAVWLAGLPVLLTYSDPMQGLLAWSQVMFVARFVASLLWLVRRIADARHNPAFVFVGSFALLITVGSLLLMLPVCRVQLADQPEAGAPPLVALFTATSAACVTGLTVVDTGSYWTRTGQCIILLLIQLGGLGVMTFGAFFALGQRRGFLVRESVLLGKLLEADDVQAVRRLIRSILIFTLASELLGAIVLSTLSPAESPLERAWFGVFHSVSAFCNAGFALLPNSLVGLGGRWQVFLGVAGLIIVGGLGFDVLRNTAAWLRAHLPQLRLRRRATFLADDAATPTRLTLTSRLVLTTTAGLLIAGTAAFLLFETGSLTANQPLGERAANAWFQSVTCRTAGFNTVDFALYRPATKFCAIVLMFIGGSPGSTAGGIKTVVFALTVLATVNIIRGRERLELAGRTVPHGYLQRAAAILMLGLSVVLTATLLIAMFESRPDRFLDQLFEATSAFATVGLSTGITPRLTAASQLVLVLTMFLGRVGPLTVLLALARPHTPPSYEYPTERVMLG